MSNKKATRQSTRNYFFVVVKPAYMSEQSAGQSGVLGLLSALITKN